MADVRDRVELVINGRPFRDWTSATVNIGLDQAARQATLDIVRDRTRTVPKRLTAPLGSLVELFVVDVTGTGRRDRVVTGYIEALVPTFDAEAFRFSVEVESTTTDVVASDPVVDSMTFTNLTRGEIASRICSAHNIVVNLVGVEDSARLSRFKIDKGESAHAALQRLIKPEGWMLTDDEWGDLVLTTAAASRAQTALVLGENLLVGDNRVDASKRYSEYVCSGQRAGDDVNSGESVSEVVGTVSDPWHGNRVRRLNIDPERSLTPEDARRRAEYEAAMRAGQSAEFAYTVRGLRQRPGGDLWLPNLLVPVDDPWSGVDGDLLIVSVELSATPSGERTSMSLAPKEGYIPFRPTGKGRKPRRRRYSDPAGFARAAGLDVAAYLAEIAGKAYGRASAPVVSGEGAEP